MGQRIRSLTHTARKFASVLKASLVATAALGLVACQQVQTPYGLFGGPAFSKDRNQIPYTRNTQYDCRNFSGSGWKGIASGTVYNFEVRYVISQAGCFNTKPECEAWLVLMRSYIDVPKFIRCNAYSA
ncbi:hypothetical protein [Roseibium sp. MMSF_3544]|uniref:hypothetical protein n=1 Tax=unclassified Roseibium TaxID=2629323 RepID=UPI0027401EC5|nr:hypothetical protein [Roseibium sp. MMSF_3544]